MSAIHFKTKPGFQSRLLKACQAAYILIAKSEIDECNDYDINKLVMTCVNKGISAAWLLFERGRMWYSENNWWDMNGQPLSFKDQNWN
ncbi:MAG: hypothetical protein LCH44_10555 [Bacteroidetes bacterium]|jgi:hypothetical protein|nr:hypothetical protein [Bacteroidota bacterium]